MAGGWSCAAGTSTSHLRSDLSCWVLWRETQVCCHLSVGGGESFKLAWAGFRKLCGGPAARRRGLSFDSSFLADLWLRLYSIVLPSVSRADRVSRALVVAVEDAFQNNWISCTYYNSFMSVVFPDYVLGDSNIAMRLWDERLPLKRASDFVSPDVSLIPVSAGLELHRCTGPGQVHFHVKWDGQVRTRQEWRVINRCFEFGNRADAQHTMIDAASWAHSLQHESRLGLLRAFAAMPVGTPNCMAVAMLTCSANGGMSAELIALSWPSSDSCRWACSES